MTAFEGGIFALGVVKSHFEHDERSRLPTGWDKVLTF